MRTTSTTRRPLLLGLTFLLTVMLSAGVALAQHGHDEAHTQDDHATTEQVDHAVDAHAADAHATDAHAVDAHGEEHGDAHGEHDPYHLPNFVSLFFGKQLQGREAILEPIFSAIIAILMMTILVGVATKRTDKPGRLQVAVEMIMGGLDGMVHSIIGPTGRRYTPYLGTLFIFIWLNNLSGLVPFFHASTSVLNTTVALAICTFFYVQGIALKENGIGGYLFHMAGSPRSGVEWGIMPLMFVLHLSGEFIKPMSLSLRLFGNVMGEDKLIAVFVVLGAGMLSFTGLPIGIPIHVPIVFLALLTSTIQALVFTLLSMVYIALMLPHDEHHGEAHAH
jgi:F-type H+-transporting ATPase subunit a